MRRTTPLTRTIRSHRTPRERTDAESAAYQEATERARCDDGFLVCQRCGRGLLDREAERHHLIHRSLGGPTDAGNLAVLCHACHALVHGLYQPLHPDLAPPRVLRSEPGVLYLVNEEDVPPMNPDA